MLPIQKACRKINDRFGYRGAGVALFREEPGGAFSVLIGKRSNNPGKRKWSFPGGQAKKGEALLKTAKREFFEETSIKLESLNPTYINHIKISIPFFEWGTFVFVTSSHTQPNKSDEFTKLGWAGEQTFKKLNLHFGVWKVYKMYEKYRREKLGLG